MRRARIGGFAALLSLVVLMLMVMAPSGAAKARTCFISNLSLVGSDYTSLQAAVDAAAAGDTLTVRGTCIGTTNISKSLTITGVPDDTLGAPTLDGGDKERVLHVSSSYTNLYLNTLTIQHGFATDSFGGGGILVGSAWVHLNGVTVRENVANVGGGISVVWNTLILEGSTVSGNHTVSTGAWLEDQGGGIYQLGGRIILYDSTVSGNRTAGSGGGIYTSDDMPLNRPAELELRGTSSITGNRADEGGGIYSNATIQLWDSSSVAINRADLLGGGVYNANRSDLSLYDSSQISQNRADAFGGGIYNEPEASYQCWAGCWNAIGANNNNPDGIFTQPVSVVSVSTSEYDFGTVALADLPQWTTITFTNNSAQPVWLFRYHVPVGFLAPGLDYGNCYAIEAWGTCSTLVFFRPTAWKKYELGTYSGPLITTWSSAGLVGMTSTALAAVLTS